ncbi:hypothetical protein OG711_11235 [Streptomyces uncialis]|uniref:hypothetical protein n=1 Tax=Streptomyces uncialis TaxID=1048205 RepID=UPI002E361016|nr:hypothetical protein [Streptomyces uncialis]
MVAVVNKAGFNKEFDFAQLSAPEAMQRALAAAFATRSRSWNSHLTAITCWDKIVIFVRFLSELENPPGDLDDLTVASLKRWRTLHVGTNTGRLTLIVIRKLLQQEPRLATGPVAEELSRRIPSPEPSKQSFGKDERERMALAAQRQFRSAWIRIRENTALLDSWRSGALAEGSREWKIGTVLDHLARTGDVPRTVFPSGQVYVTHRRLLGGASAEKSWGRLFLTPRELTALAVLLTDRFGWNLSVYSRMPAPTAAPSAGERASVTYQVEIEKRRAGGGRWFSTENITDSGADSRGRLITQALEATVHGRVLASRLAPGTDFLMVTRSHNSLRDTRDMDRPRPVGPLAFGVTDEDAKRWGRENRLGGSPFQRSRRTTVTGEGRPLQHTQGTHESVYVLPDQQVQRASRNVFGDGALEALEQAWTVVFGGHLADKPDPDHQEAAVADCADETTSPWPAVGVRHMLPSRVRMNVPSYVAGGSTAEEPG